jgi:putative ABC transport system substrate-binding protein
VIGLLSGTNREARLIGAIWQGLNEAGFVEGQNAAMEYRFAEGRFERLPALAAELVANRAAVIIGMQSVAAPLAAKAVTPAVPVVFSIGGDPVRLGLVASLARPGGNVTGATFLVNTLSAKRLELLHDLLPSAKVMGLLVNPKNPAAPSETSDVHRLRARSGCSSWLRTPATSRRSTRLSPRSSSSASARSRSPPTPCSTRGAPSSSRWRRAMRCR